jgi:hypothetical protein
MSELRSAAAESGAAAVTAAGVRDVSDEQVVAVARADLQPKGAMHEYLHNACVGAIVGETIFVHGAVDAQTAGV